MVVVTAVALAAVGAGAFLWSAAGPPDRIPVTALLPGTPVSAVAADGSTIWAGVTTPAGARLLRIEATGLAVHDESARFGTEAGDTITALFVDGDSLWIATNHNTWLATPFRRTGERPDPAAAGPFLRRWLAAHGALEARCARTSLLAFLDEEDSAWLAHFKGSVYRWERRTGHCREVYRPPSIYEWPVALAADRRFVYVGTRGAGLAVVDRTTLKAVTLASSHHPLFDPSDVVPALATDERRLWAGSRRGLLVIDRSWLASVVQASR